MNLQMVDLRHVRTGIRLTRRERLEAAYMALRQRTAQRQAEAKADFDRRGIAPKVDIGAGYVPPSIAKHFAYTYVRGLLA